MKYLLALAFLVVAAQASPLKEAAEKADSSKNETVKYAETTSGGLERPTRGCEASDLNKIQAQLTTALEKQIEKLLGSSRRRRDSSSGAGASSESGPDGKTKSTAFANSKTTADKAKEPALLKEGGPSTPVIEGGKPGAPLPPPAEGVKPGAALPPTPVEEGKPGAALPPPSNGSAPAAPGSPLAPPPPAAHGDGPTPPSPLIPGDEKGNIVQNVKGAASMEKGTAVASAVAKREAVVQTVGASGNKAVATGTSHKGGADANIQKIEAAGGAMGVASAVVDKNSTEGATKIDPKTGKPVAGVVLQNVKASGQKAVATADAKKDGGNIIQDALAEGEELSIASVSSSSGSGDAPPAEPLKLVKRDVTSQKVAASGNKAISSADAKTKEGDSTLQNVDAIGGDMAIATATAGKKTDATPVAPPPAELLRKERSLCEGLKMNDEIRLLVRTTVEKAFTELKQELKLVA